ncbi:hypothetical protein TRFO_30776 [Tritrichomonas foetus]|uniref:Intimal thickness related receptor IRP domain-containing protein n=1 Tax=Tritrichomonas foetus TaxID=1144522 RepID=A0A1J4JSV3_9EUKA|nr:hypothetical protein TRFO_30776 [Tritrichomonas foetus]|eukprot:OHT02207.1 hypothetical protein TRFO_30776 [Tritrichomonas foetus]
MILANNTLAKVLVSYVIYISYFENNESFIPDVNIFTQICLEKISAIYRLKIGERLLFHYRKLATFFQKIFMFLFILFYKFTTHLKSSHNAAFLSNFGFSANATYHISATPSNLDPYCFAFLNKSEYNKFRTSVLGDLIRCSDISYSQYYHEIKNSITPENGIIEEKGIYYPLFINSAIELSGVNIKITETYRNPTSCFDYRWFGVVNGKIGVVVILGFISILWIVNWVLHFHIQIGLHYCLTAVFLSNLFYQIVRLLELQKLDKVDISNGLTITRVIFSLFSEIIFYATILFCAKGWCVVRDSISVKEIILCLTYSTLFMVFRILSQYIFDGTWAIVILILAIISIVLFIRELMNSINNAQLLIYAHLLSIANAGYDAKTTPIYQKHLMYQKFQFIFLGGLIMILIYLITAIFADVPFVAQELVEDCIEIVVLAALEILFRLRGGKRGNYTLIPEQSDLSTDEVSLADIEGLNINSPPFTRGGRVWTDEMPLPALPVIVPTRRPEVHQPIIKPEPRHAEVVLSSPDGTESIKAKLITDGDQREEI